MGARSGAATLTPFIVEGDTEADRRALARRVRKSAFTPLDTSGEHERSAGWVEFEDSESWELAPTSFLFGDNLILSWRVDQIRVPASRVKSELEAWSKTYAESQGKAPGKMAKTEAKETILRKLRRRVLPTTKTTDVTWNFDSGRLWIWSTTEKLLEEVTDILHSELGLQLHRLSPGARVQLSGEDLSKLNPSAKLWGADVAEEVGRHV